MYLVLKKLDLGRAINVQIFLLMDPMLLNEAAEGFLDLVLPEVVLHAVGVFRAVGRLPKQATPGQEVEQDAGCIHVYTTETEENFEGSTTADLLFSAINCQP